MRLQSEFDPCRAEDVRAIGVEVHRAAPRPPVAGRLLNLSSRGAKAFLDSPIAGDEVVTLKFQHAGVNSELSTGGTVKRLRACGDGTWTVTCLFSQRLPAVTLLNLICPDRPENRKAPRYPIDGRAMVDWEEGVQAEVQLEDISAGGFRMLAAEPVTIGARLQLVLRTAAHKRFVVPAVTRWQSKSPDGYSVGCQFLYDQGQHLVDAILSEGNSSPSSNLGRIVQIVRNLRAGQH